MRKLGAGVAVITLLAVSCAEPAVRTSGDVRNVGAVTVTLRATPSQVRVGQAVQLTLRLVNNSGREEALRFQSGQRYDFWVTRADDEVWRWSDDQMFAQALETDSIGGQTGTTFTESWMTTEPGTFTVHGEVIAQGYEGSLSGEVTVE